MRRIALLVVLLATVGCASSGAGPKGDAATLPAIAAGKSRLMFYRTSSAIASMDKPDILMDSVVIGKSESGCFSYADVDPGKHLIECKGGDRISVQTAAGETAYIETSVKATINNFQTSVEQKPEAEAKQKIAKLKFKPPVGMPAAGAATKP
jgi:hypothetical protein